MPGVVLENVDRVFGSVRAVSNVSLTVEDGEFVTLLGPSGCGKTTTLRMVAGLERNTGGRIVIGDRMVSDAARGLFVAPERRDLGMVFQSYAIWPHMRVFDNVAYPLRIRRLPKADVDSKVKATLDLVEMGQYADRPAPALSGGQQQRVAIARALVFEPRVLLLDEPLSNLDARLRTQMGEEFRGVQQRLGITSLYVTHDQEEAMSLSDRIAVMHAGEVLQFGKPEEIYERPVNRIVAQFFGSPNVLAATVHDAHKHDGEIWLSLEGEGWSGRCKAGEQFPSGASVVVVIRPENMTIGQTGGDDRLTWTGKVTNAVYRGANRTISVETPKQTLQVDLPALRAAKIGETVEVSAAAAHAWAVKP
jgi:iron(III) transport system ATP-binding protein